MIVLNWLSKLTRVHTKMVGQPLSYYGSEPDSVELADYLDA